MKNKRTELIVGIFGLCAIVVLIAGLIFLKEFRFNRHTNQIPVLFDSAAGLKEGDPVMVAGVRKGSVRTIALQGGQVRVVLTLEFDIQLSDDATFLITSTGLVGLKYVEVSPGRSGRPLDISQPAQGTNKAEVFEVVGMVGDLIAKMSQLVETINRAMTEEGILVSIEQTLVEAREMMSMMRSVVSENRNDLSEAVQDFKATSGELRDIVEDNRTTIDSTIAKFHASSERIVTTLEQLEEMSAALKDISDRIDRGDGTLGKMVNSRELYDDLQKTTREINLLIEDIKKNPGKYIKFSIFDF